MCVFVFFCGPQARDECVSLTQACTETHIHVYLEFLWFSCVCVWVCVSHSLTHTHTNKERQTDRDRVRKYSRKTNYHTDSHWSSLTLGTPRAATQAPWKLWKPGKNQGAKSHRCTWKTRNQTTIKCLYGAWISLDMWKSDLRHQLLVTKTSIYHRSSWRVATFAGNHWKITKTKTEGRLHTYTDQRNKNKN